MLSGDTQGSVNDGVELSTHWQYQAAQGSVNDKGSSPGLFMDVEFSIASTPHHTLGIE